MFVLVLGGGLALLAGLSWGGLQAVTTECQQVLALGDSRQAAAGAETRSVLSMLLLGLTGLLILRNFVRQFRHREIELRRSSRNRHYVWERHFQG